MSGNFRRFRKGLNVKKFIASIVAVASALFLNVDISISATVSDYPAGTPASGIASSRHNMGSMGRVIHTVDPGGFSIVPPGYGTTEICVFCHTPHHTNTSYGVGPLWNRKVQDPSTYSAYGYTVAGTNITTTGSTTLACLSCHDGITTFDNIVNAPGKDGVVPGGSDRNWFFLMPTNIGTLDINALHKFQADGSCATMCHFTGDPAKRLLIGTNLADDHPVSVPYNAGTAASLRDTSTVISAVDLTAGLTTTNDNITQNRWAVKGFVSETGTIADLLRNGNVECTSCHDPHFRNLSWDEAEPTWDSVGGYVTYCTPGEDCSDGNFLRRVGGNTGSGVCRTCHNK